MASRSWCSASKNQSSCTPGRPKTTLTPWIFKHRASAWPPVNRVTGPRPLVPAIDTPSTPESIFAAPAAQPPAELLAQIGPLHFRVGLEFRCGSGEDDVAGLQDVAAMGDVERHVGIL